LDFQAIFFNYSVTTLFQLPTQENKTIVDELAIPITAAKFAQLNHIIVYTRSMQMEEAEIKQGVSHAAC